MSAPREVAYFTITKAGVAYDIPVQATPQRDGPDRVVPVARNPKIAFPPPLSTANPDGTAARRNYDIDEVIFTDWSGGMGEDKYAAATNPSSFQTSQCDTRWPGTLVCRPLPTQLGSDVASVGEAISHVTELNYTNATLLWWGPLSTGHLIYRYTGAAWTALTDTLTDTISSPRGLVQDFNGVILSATTTGPINLLRSADGVTWALMAKGAMTQPILPASFDNRVWAIDAVISGAATAQRCTYTAYYSTDLWSAAAGAGTWTAGATIVTSAIEVALKTFVWVYPPDKGRVTLWLLTNSRLFYYDYYAATPTWVTWFTFQMPQQAATLYSGDAVVSPRNNNLYVALYGKEWVWEFTGATITQLSWNKRHGMPAGRRLSPYRLDANDSGVYAFCGAHPADTASKGAVLWMDEGGQFHHLYNSAAKLVYGGGVGTTKIWVVANSTSTGQVWELANPDTLTVPPLVTGRTFDSAALVHTTAWINGGLANVNKRVLYAEVDCLKADGTVGLDTGATLQVEIVTRAAATSLGTLTDASTFPAVLAVAGGIACKEWQVRLTLTRGTATSATPIVRAVKLGYRPRPKQRYTYSLRADVRDECPAFQTPDGKFRGRSASTLRLFLDEVGDSDDAGQDDPLVGLSYGGRGNSLHPRYRNIPQCEILVQAQESVDKADGLYLISCNDVSAPTSG